VDVDVQAGCGGVAAGAAHGVGGQVERGDVGRTRGSRGQADHAATRTQVGDAVAGYAARGAQDVDQ
jgi:hypothetical protein